MEINSFCDRILFNYHRIEVKTRPFLARFRRKKLNNTDFTIISNNCWGGICYEYYGLQKLYPTVGMYFYAEDYVKFISKLSYYVGLEMQMITPNESKHRSSLYSKGETNVPVGVLDDIEVVFLHYLNPDIAKAKWRKRVKRINWDNIIYKFSYMNECNDQNIEDFLRITNGEKRICFVGKKKWGDYGVYEVPANSEHQVVDDTTWFNKYVDVESVINEKF